MIGMRFNAYLCIDKREKAIRARVSWDLITSLKQNVTLGIKKC